MERLNSEKIRAEEVGILDNNSEWLGIPKSHLMECAGYAFTMEIVSRYNLAEGDKVLIFCGTGNNGGDGFVVARHLSSFKVHSTVILLGPEHKIRTDEATLNWNILKNSLNRTVDIEIIRDSTELTHFGIDIDKDHDYKLIIDGMLGTGIQGKLREPIATAVEFINEAREHQDLKVVSIDVPSGLDPNTGYVSDKAVKADLVITFHRNKKGMEANSEYIQDLVVKSIGVPYEAELFVGKGDLLPTLKTRKSTFHKGQFGRMLVIGGSKNYSGAPAYSSLTGVGFGLDLVITYTPSVVGDVIRSYSPNLIVRTTPGDFLNLDAQEEIFWLIEWANAILIGPGMSQEKETEKLLIKILEKVKQEDKACVLDADALKLVKNHLDLITGGKIIVTPHEGELKIMTGQELPPHEEVDARMKKIQSIAENLGVVLLVKGPYDYISDGNKVRINKTGCAEMAIGGTGDVLAGLCASFLATENSPFNSACSAAFLNGLLGEFCKAEKGSRFNAMDMIDSIMDVLSEKF